MISQASYFRLIYKIIPGVAGGNIGQDYTFDDQPDIRYARLQGLCFYTDADVAVAFPTSTPLVSAALIQNISFTFFTNDPDEYPLKDQATGKAVKDPDAKASGELGRFSGGQDTIEWIPASTLHVNQSNTAGGQPSFVRQMIHWKDRYVVWQKSKIKFAPGGLGNVNDVAIAIGCWYTFMSPNGQIISPRN